MVRPLRQLAGRYFKKQKVQSRRREEALLQKGRPKKPRDSEGVKKVRRRLPSEGAPLPSVLQARRVQSDRGKAREVPKDKLWSAAASKGLGRFFEREQERKDGEWRNNFVDKRKETRLRRRMAATNAKGSKYNLEDLEDDEDLGTSLGTVTATPEDSGVAQLEEPDEEEVEPKRKRKSDLNEEESAQHTAKIAGLDSQLESLLKGKLLVPKKKTKKQPEQKPAAAEKEKEPEVLEVPAVVLPGDGDENRASGSKRASFSGVAIVREYAKTTHEITSTKQVPLKLHDGTRETQLLLRSILGDDDEGEPQPKVQMAPKAPPKPSGPVRNLPTYIDVDAEDDFADEVLIDEDAEEDEEPEEALAKPEGARTGEGPAYPGFQPASNLLKHTKDTTGQADYDELAAELESELATKKKAKAEKRTLPVEEQLAAAREELKRLNKQKQLRMEGEADLDDLVEPVGHGVDDAELIQSETKKRKKALPDAQAEASQLLDELMTAFESNATGEGSVKLADLDTLLEHTWDMLQIHKEYAVKKLARILQTLYEQQLMDTHSATPAGDLGRTRHTLLFAKLLTVCFPVTDFRHVIITPLATFLAACLATASLDSLWSVAVGLFQCTLLWEIVHEAKRFCPEALVFLCNALTLTCNPDSEKARIATLAHGGFERNNSLLAPAFSELRFSPGLLRVATGVKPETKVPSALSFTTLIAHRPQDTPVVRLQLANTVYELLRLYSDISTGVAGYPEAFRGVLDTLENVEKAGLHPALLKRHASLTETVRNAVSGMTARAPLTLQAHRPIPLKLYEPLIDAEREREHLNDRRLRQDRRRLERETTRDIRLESKLDHVDQEHRQDMEDKQRVRALNQIKGHIMEDRTRKHQMDLRDETTRRLAQKFSEVRRNEKKSGKMVRKVRDSQEKFERRRTDGQKPKKP
eukprot:TRINITY_DN1174_c0_g1_i1.p1 TRINITY_DN1174_c0_g1~~TRINITY_DN1174_c0_g1_i1.p1  ORF type:complete len:924 (-),score=186.44 TRINITY_DN1174_c0_g1_i1:35-2806(-)